MSGVRVPAPLLYLLGTSLRKTLINQFKTFCLTNHLISNEDLIFIALSGGIDSMALLHAFLQIQDEFKLEIRAIHINHGVRGAEAERDEQFVRRQCQSLNVPLIVSKLNLKGKTDEHSLRDARYAEFEKIVQSYPKAKIATGHTLNDNLETFLMRLAKGSSLKGLTGIPRQRGPYIRPFLFLTRAEISRFVQQNQIPFVQDSSNQDLNYLRNKVRHKLIPHFEEVFGKAIWSGATHTLEHLNQFYQLFEQESKKRYQHLVKKEGQTLTIETEHFKDLHPLYRKQILSYCISAYYPLNYQITDQQLEDIQKFAEQTQTGARFSIKNDLILLKERERLRFVREPDALKTVLRLDKNQTIEFDGLKLSIKQIERDQIKFTQNPDVEFICGDRLVFPLLVRYWQEGDRFCPLGLGKRQKLKEFFVNQKIEWLQKKQIPILLNGNEIVWVCGLRLDQRYRITKTCKTVFKLELIKRRNN
ncbi:MAG: tRNA lysidine(34) synthetase TilS [Caldisericaceae bacterium]|nr:tRNA lysidine(34) synthetase TilS [Caldisericaceae bacterium]